MADRPSASAPAGRVKSPGPCVWPRVPDEVATLSTLATQAAGGQSFEPVKVSNTGLYVVAGDFHGATALAGGGNWYPIFAGDILPAGVALASDASDPFGGRLSLRWYVCESQQDLQEIYKIAELVSHGAATGSASSSLPNRCTPARATVAAGVISHTWTQSGFLFALLLMGPGNTGTINIGTTFGPLSAKDSIEDMVGTSATGFTGTGTVNGDTIEILEFGRV